MCSVGTCLAAFFYEKAKEYLSYPTFRTSFAIFEIIEKSGQNLPNNSLDIRILFHSGAGPKPR
uniref:Uncharacterized protein n=1 Tax=Candidatus Kentrum sp. DK TaxID=2126562 RepID=A0A450TLU7_9GAMM|nr:MAG: hypothetical protein BECKDK2373B_GA0170837_12204 [Candidatus Kentron sp. DK]